MQKPKTFRPDCRPSSKRRQRLGASPEFAKSMARAEFGRFYVDEKRLREATRSVAEAIARRKPAPKPDAKQQEKPGEPEVRTENADPPPPDQPAKKPKPMLWHQPSVRERRTEIAEAKARLLDARKRGRCT